MRTDPDLILNAGRPAAEHLLVVLLAVAIGLVAGLTAGIFLMSDLLPTLA